MLTKATSMILMSPGEGRGKPVRDTQPLSSERLIKSVMSCAQDVGELARFEYSYLVQRMYQSTGMRTFRSMILLLSIGTSPELRHCTISPPSCGMVLQKRTLTA